jgi:hypothetical protein
VLGRLQVRGLTGDLLKTTVPVRRPRRTAVSVIARGPCQALPRRSTGQPKASTRRCQTCRSPPVPSSRHGVFGICARDSHQVMTVVVTEGVHYPDAGAMRLMPGRRVGPRVRPNLQPGPALFCAPGRARAIWFPSGRKGIVAWVTPRWWNAGVCGLPEIIWGVALAGASPWFRAGVFQWVGLQLVRQVR